MFLSNGDLDPTVDPAATAAYVAALKNGGFNVSEYNLPTSHNLTQTDVQLAAEWLSKSF